MNHSQLYTYPGSTSFKARLVKLYLRLSGTKSSAVNDFKNNHFNTEPAPIPRSYFDRFQVDTTTSAGRNVYTIAPKGPSSGKYILYIHGGAYISNLVSQHWDLAEQLVSRTNRTVVVPDYPLAPVHTALDAFSMLDAVYKNLLTQVTPDRIIFMGDSAGAGLALAFAQKLKKEGGAQPEQIILLSPWLDVTMTNPGIQAVEKKDPMLSVTALQMAGKAYAGKLDTRNYLVSPIYGSLDGLAKISLFIGGDDIFIADSRKLKELLDQKGISLNYFEYPHMFHVWVAVTWLKEAKIAIDQLTKLIL